MLNFTRNFEILRIFRYNRPMKIFAKFALIVCSVGVLYGFELVLNTGKENAAPFATLHLKHEQKFACVEHNAGVKARNYYECIIAGVVDKDLKEQEFAFFDLKFQKNETNTRIFIYPKAPVKRYNLSQELYKDADIKGDLDDTNSTNFTFVFSAEIPHLTEQEGLNFDIVFPNVANPAVGALDLDSNPVTIPQSGDINVFLRIKNDYEQENYQQVISDATNAISRYEGSIFMNEFMLYRLRAQNELYTKNADYRNQEQLEAMIDEAKVWNRNFASDRNYPEVLYISLRAYIALEQKSNADYTIQILSTEHEGNFFAELGLLDYADYLLRLRDTKRAKIIFNDLYYKSKSVHIATRAALSTAKLALNEKDKTKAMELINTVLRSNKEYFSKDKATALDIAGLLAKENEFDTSAEIYELAFNAMTDVDTTYEQTLRNLALMMSKTKSYDKAKRYLDLYMEDYKNSEHIALIKEAADNVFFNLPDSNTSFLHARYKELQSEYENEIATKALIADVTLYFDENNTAAVMGYKNAIEELDNAGLKDLLARSALKKLDEFIKADDCLGATALNEEYAPYELAQKFINKKAMLACFTRTFRTEQARAYIAANRAEDKIYYDLQEALLDLNDKDYKNALALSNSVLNSRTLKSEDEKFRAYYYKFLAQFRNGEYNEAMATLKILDDFPMDYRMVELYNEFLGYCVDNNLTTTILTYAPKAIDYQNLKGVNVYTPELEFAYLSALNLHGYDSEALAVLTDLLKVSRLTPAERARALYMQSEIYERRREFSAQRQSLNSCVQLKELSPWQDLCRQRLDLLQER